MFLKKRSALSKEEQNEKSSIIIRKLLQTESYKNADWIFTYIDMGSEVKTTSFIEQAWKDGKKVAVPIAKKDRLMYFVQLTTFDGLSRTKLGVMEPDEPIEKQVLPEENTMFIVPGSMFDVRLNRCGYGGGYYDTYISEKNVKNTIGICYDFQLIDEIPTEEFDRKLKRIITEKRDIC